MYTIYVTSHEHYYHPNSFEEASDVAKELSRDHRGAQVSVMLYGHAIVLYRDGKVVA